MVLSMAGFSGVQVITLIVFSTRTTLAITLFHHHHDNPSYLIEHVCKSVINPLQWAHDVRVLLPGGEAGRGIWAVGSPQSTKRPMTMNTRPVSSR
ncbi:hypothetical protein DFH09DRAFT_627255 [Mycena vulgaris]|nr:hypothetical protein DFH09DRAFT_627255 [Mycena vulgaris]